MNPLVTSPNHGRFNRADVTNVTVAHQLVFGSDVGADIVWVSGWLDQPYTVNPVRIRGYDGVGNLIASIRLNDVVDHDYSSVAPIDRYGWLHSREHGGIVEDATDGDGNVITVFGPAVKDVQIQDMVVDQDGVIYCAMCPGGFNCYSPKPGIPYGVDELVSILATAYVTVGGGFSDLIELYTIKQEEFFHGYFRKYNRNGDRIPFPELHGGLILSIAVDSDGSIVVGGVPVGAEQYVLRRYDKDGNLVWSARKLTTDSNDTYIYGVFQLAIATTGDIYCIGQDTSSSFIKKYSTGGTLLWTRTLGEYSVGGLRKSMVLDDDGYIYTGGGYINHYLKEDGLINWMNSYHTPTHIQKWDSDGNLVLSKALSQTTVFYTENVQTIPLVVEIMTYSNGLIYIVPEDGRFFTCNTELEQGELEQPSAAITSTNAVSPIAVDSSNRLFYPAIFENNAVNVGGVMVGRTNYHLVVYDTEHNLLWRGCNAAGELIDVVPWQNPLSATIPGVYPSVHGWYVGVQDPSFIPYSTLYGIGSYRAWTLTGRSIVLTYNNSTPSISIPCKIFYPDWQGDRYTGIPSLLLPMTGLAIFSWSRDYVGELTATIYRLYITGTPNIELKMSSFQIRRNTNVMWLSVVCHVDSPDLMEQIANRSTEEIFITRGVMFRDKTEQSDEMARVSINNIRFDVGGNNRSITIDGNAIETIVQKTRTIKGISYKSLSGGKRRIRCEVDTYLSPGDIVDLGSGDTMVVADLIYNVNTQSAVMEITESG